MTAIRELATSTFADHEIEVLVIDNDPDGSAATTTAGRSVRYVSEPRPGLAAVRNRALDETAGSDILIFIDDDEVPESGWLAALLSAFAAGDADGIAGRVVTPLPDDLDPWLRAVGAFVRPQREEGQLMPEAATNNLLLSRDAVRASGVRFDPRFGLTGGEDSMFTLEFHRAGRTIRWTNRAIVREAVLPERVNRSWILMRAYRNGNSSARVRIALAAGRGSRLAARAKNVVAGLARLVGGAALWVAGAITFSLRRRARGVRAIYRGAGSFTGTFGGAFREYGRN